VARGAWRVAQCRILPKPGRAAAPYEHRNPRKPHDVDRYYRSLLLVAFASVEEAEATLALQGWLLLCVSTGIMLVTALSARWLSRKTLVPLTRMLESARGLDATDAGWSLAEAGTKDELDELGHAFNGLLSRLREAYGRQRRFSSDASHQLRTPVGVMIGNLEVALRCERSCEEYRQVIELAHSRAVRLGQITEALLFLSRADSTTLLQVERLDLRRWVAEYLGAQQEHPRAGDMIADGVEGAPLWVKAHPQLLGQLLDNLLDNAFKYSRPGTPVVLTTPREADSALLAVEDSGSGIAPGDLPRIFDPFYRTAIACRQHSPGIGLGLSVVQGIAKAFGGTVVVRSELGRGSRFEVRLPLTDASSYG